MSCVKSPGGLLTQPKLFQRSDGWKIFCTNKFCKASFACERWRGKNVYDQKKKKKGTTKILQNMGGGVGPLEVSLFRVVMF